MEDAIQEQQAAEDLKDSQENNTEQARVEAAEPNPQQFIQDQLAAELIATRQQLAAVQQQLALERAAAQESLAHEKAAAEQRYAQMIASVEQFVAGNATVGDVVKTVGANVAQDDSLWKGVLVGAAAAVLLTSGPVREVMGKSVGTLFPGLQSQAGSKASGTTAGETATTTQGGE